MMMFTMGWWFTVVHPSLNTVVVRSYVIFLIFPMFFSSINFVEFWDKLRGEEGVV